MKKIKNLSKEFPSVMDQAYKDYKRHKKVTDIMTAKVITTTPEASMADCAIIMGEKHIGSLIVVKYDTPVGIVTERDLLSNVLARGKKGEEVKVEAVMSYPLITICASAEIREAAKTMIHKKGRLAVFECGKLVGIITAADLIRSLPEAPETQTKVEDFMTKEIITSDEQTIISDIAKIMGEKRIGSIIITRKENPIGIFTERDLFTNFLAKKKPLNTPVNKAYSSPLITAPSNISVHEAAKIMTTKHIRRLPLTKDNLLTGIITARDLVEAYSK